jgi:two-component system, NarL family, sensor histidine kinase UhpB
MRIPFVMPVAFPDRRMNRSRMGPEAFLKKTGTSETGFATIGTDGGRSPGISSVEQKAFFESKELKVLFECAPFGLIMINQKGDFIYVNPGFSEIFGYSPEEIPDGRTWFRKAYPDSQYRKGVISAWINDLQRSKVREKRPREFVVHCREGNQKIIQFIAVQLETGENMLVCLDVTENRQAEEMLRNSEKEYRTIFENTGTAMCIIEADTTISMVNEEFVRLSGYSRKETEGRMRWTDHVVKEDIPTMRAYHWQRRADPSSVPREYSFRFIDRSEQIKEIALTVSMIPGTQKSVASLMDITSHKKAKKNLQESEARYRLLTDNVTDVIWLMDMSLRFKYVSPSAEKLSGYSEEEALAMPLERLLTPESFKKAQEVLAEELRNKGRKGHNLSRSVVLELEIVCKNGNTLWSEVNARFLRNAEGRVREILGVARNIAARKEMEDRLRQSSLQLRALSAHLQRIREEERASIAREIHDELGQSLTALSMDLSWLSKKLPRGETPLHERVSSMSDMVKTTVYAIRKILSELRPGVLDDLGVVAAIEWQAQDFQKRTGIECKFIPPRDELVLDREPSTALFRIFQEILTNVVRHAKATRVEVILCEDEDAGRLILSVNDNGTGITEKEITSSTSLGLLGMYERLLLLGGDLQIRGEQGRGTTVTARIPFRRTIVN